MKTLLSLILLFLCLRPAGAQSSVMVDKIVNIRETSNGSSREFYTDVIQYRLYQNGTVSQFQRINGTNYAWNGGAYGSAAKRSYYSAILAFRRWQENSYTLWASHRPSWLPVSESRTQPSEYNGGGILHHKVATTGGGGGGGLRFVDAQLLTDAFWAVMRSAGRLDQFDWTSLRRLTGNQIRSLYRTLGDQAASSLGNAALRSEFTALGEEMALLKEQQLVDMVTASRSLRDRARFARERSVRIADIYSRMFDAAVRPGMLNQLSQYSRDYELTLRRVEGNWTTYTPEWTRRDNGRPVFNDVVGASGSRLEYDDSAFPRIYFPTLRKWFVVAQDTTDDSQIIVEEATGKRYRLRVQRNSAGVRTGTIYEHRVVTGRPIAGPITYGWGPTTNPFR